MKATSTLTRPVWSAGGRALQALCGERIPTLRGTLTVPAAHLSSIKRARVAFGRYERAERVLVQRHLRADLDTVELGCGIGVISHAVVSQLDATSRYVGLEANPALIDVARGNIAGKGSSSTGIVHGALTAKDEPVSLSIAESNFHETRVSDGVGKVSSGRLVPGWTLGRMLREHGIGPFQLVCDIEGAETYLLEESHRDLEACELLIVELHDVATGDRDVSIESSLKRLRALGYDILDHIDDVFALQRKS